jgi:hypothetical protein
MGIEYIEWNRNGLCGAASAHMVLHARGVVGTTPQEQEDIWTSIKDHTNAKSTAPAKKPCSGIVPEIFNHMVRESCSGSGVMCWSTHPLALKGALKASLGTRVPITLSKLSDDDAANEVIKDCLNRGALPIVLINNGTHWVVVHAWDDAAERPVKMFDPAVGAPSEHTVGEWNIDFMSVVGCGKFEDLCVVVQVGP